MKNAGLHKKYKTVYSYFRWATGLAIKSLAIYIVIKQEQGRIIRFILNNNYKMDSGLDVYNMFSGRSMKVGGEQPESVYFMDKFLQPTHLYMHSNPMDYPKTAQKKGQLSNSEWDQTVVVYEAFRAPKFVPDFVKEQYRQGRFDLYHDREDFNGTEKEYEEQLPGQIMEKWVSELQTTNVVRMIDELNTPGVKLP